jgi:hypothetical protein
VIFKLGDFKEPTWGMAFAPEEATVPESWVHVRGSWFRFRDPDGARAP